MSSQLDRTRALLRKYDFKTQKKYGQNFLVDEGVLRSIVDDAGVTKEDHVLEIGPGIGSMTRLLCEAAGHLTAVEIDEKLIPILREEMKEYDNFTLVEGDVLETDLWEIARSQGGREMTVVANLPYYITTPILMELMQKDLPVRSITVMVQKEVAERMQASPGTKAYGALSLAVQYYAKPVIMEEVPPSCFLPQPKVSSTVIRLERHTEPPVQVQSEKLLFDLIRDSFNQRRKTLANGLGNAGRTGLTKDEIRECIQKIGEKENVRGEALSLEQFAALADAILDFQKKKGES